MVKTKSFHKIFRKKGRFNGWERYNESFLGRYEPNLNKLAPYSSFSAERSQPIHIGYVQFGGVTGDIATTPHKTAYVTTGKQVEIVCRVKCPGLTGDYQTIIAQSAGASTTNTHFQLRWHFSAVGHMEFRSSDGTGFRTVNSGTFFTQDVWYWIRLRSHNGTGAWSFEWAADQETEPTTWTARTSGTQATWTPSTDTTNLSVGGLSGGGHPYNGQIKRVIFRLDGTRQAEFNAAVLYGDGGTGPEGNIWTIAIPKLPDISGNNRGVVTFAAGTNQPKFLPYKGSPYMYFPGVFGNNVSTPDAASLRITGDIEIVFRFSFSTDTGGTQYIGGRMDTTANRSFLVGIHSLTGMVTLFTSPDGTSGAQVAGTSTAGLPWAIRSTGWLKITLDVDDGAGNRVYKFWTAPDQNSEPTVWTQLGTTVTSVGTTSIFAGTSSLTWGNWIGLSGAAHLIGQLYRAILRNGIDGAVVADFDATKCAQTGYTDYLGNIWSISRTTTGAKTEINSPSAHSDTASIQFATDDYATVPAAAIPPLDTFQPASTVLAIARIWHNPGTVGHPIFTTKNSVANNVVGLSLRLPTTAASANLNAHVGDGTINDGISMNAATFGQRWLSWAQVQSQNPFVSGAVNNDAVVMDSSRATTTTTSTGGEGRLGAYLGGTAFIDMEFEAIYFFNRELTTTEIEEVVAAHRGGF